PPSCVLPRCPSNTAQWRRRRRFVCDEPGHIASTQQRRSSRPRSLASHIVPSKTKRVKREVEQMPILSGHMTKLTVIFGHDPAPLGADALQRHPAHTWFVASSRRLPPPNAHNGGQACP